MTVDRLNLKVEQKKKKRKKSILYNTTGVKRNEQISNVVKNFVIVVYNVTDYNGAA